MRRDHDPSALLAFGGQWRRVKVWVSGQARVWGRFEEEVIVLVVFGGREPPMGRKARGGDDGVGGVVIRSELRLAWGVWVRGHGRAGRCALAARTRWWPRWGGGRAR